MSSFYQEDGSAEPTTGYEGHSKVLASDDYFVQPDGSYHWDPKFLGLAHKSCQERCKLAMEAEDKRIFVCNTFISTSEMTPYIKLADEHGYKVFSIIVENRHGNNSVHGVPDEKRQEMDINLRKNLKFI